MDISESITFNRRVLPYLLEDLNKRRSLLLFGPRQTGKTTLLNQVGSQLSGRASLRYDLQLPSQRMQWEGDPESLRREVEAIGKQGKAPVYVFIDEIQKCPRITDVLQYLIDRGEVVVLATGSSTRKMRQVGQNWLPGRVIFKRIFPLAWDEIQWPPAKMEEVLLYGSLPGILRENDLSKREVLLDSYAQLYLEEEIRQEALIRNIPRFAQFLRIAALESGTTPNYSKMGGLVGMSHTSIAEYYRILEDTMIVTQVPSYGGSRGSVFRSPRYYFFDMGVRNAAARLGHSQGILVLQKGLLFEHFIHSQLRIHFGDRIPIHFWRTREGEEVDFILEGPKGVFAVEAKSSKNPNQDDFRGIKAFSKKKKILGGCVVCAANRPQAFGAYEAIPWWELIARVREWMF